MNEKFTAELNLADQLYESENFKEAFEIYLNLAEKGDTEAQYAVGLMYEKGLGTSLDSKLAFKYMKMSSDGGNCQATNHVGYFYSIGFGCKKNHYEAAQYFKLAAEGGSSDAMCNYGIALLYGQGVKKSISAAYSQFKQSASLNNERGKNRLELLEANYQFNSQGMVDLSKAKLSKISIVAVVVLLLLNVLVIFQTFSVIVSDDILSFKDGKAPLFVQMSSTAMKNSLLCYIPLILQICYVISAILLLLKLKIGGCLLRVLMIITLMQIIFFISYSFILIGIYISFTSIFLSFISVCLTYLVLQKKRNGIPAWNIINKRPFDGDIEVQEVFSNLTQYGQTDEYRENAPASKRFKIVYMAQIVLLFISAVICSYLIITMEGEMGMKLNWNFFSSSFAFPLSILGFFLGLKIKTTSYEPYIEYTNSNTGEKRVEKNLDIVDVIEAKVLMPLLQRFLIIPLVVGLILYYFIVICISVLGFLFPYFICALSIYLVFFLYRRYNLFSGRKYRVLLTIITSIFVLLIYLSVYNFWKSMLIRSDFEGVAQTTTEKFVPVLASVPEQQQSNQSQEQNQVQEQISNQYDESSYYGQDLVLTSKGIGGFETDKYEYDQIPTSFDGLYTRFERKDEVNEHNGVIGVFRFYDGDELMFEHYQSSSTTKVDNIKVVSPRIKTALELSVLVWMQKNYFSITHHLMKVL